MKETIRRYLANIIRKPKDLLSCRSAEQTTGQTLLESTLANSFHSWLQKAPQQIQYAVQKSNTPWYVLISPRFVLILMSLCLS
ncbi:MAG TPA: hypothetical protein VHV10_01135, partial [Ktedonobacteraceae bacterium]|nr:hypothetical protein [Ktedonobacteraceae bacterium]